MGELEGKIAVITGAGSGIGRASVLEFMAEGARVVAVDLSADALVETHALAGGSEDVLAVVADAADEGDVARYVAAALERHGRVDVLFNNAGVFASRPFLETTLDDLDRLLRVNAHSVFLGMRAVLPGMIERGAGAIVNNASVNGVLGLTASAAYTASKHAVVGLTRAAAVDVGRYGVRVNAICPALARTPMLADLADEEQAERAAQRLVPLRRTSDPREQARAAVFLASDRASFVNGEALLVDGGLVNCRPM
ncbi:MAG: SDR family oxidoreductase [Actinobacteria bacterium]|nr:SDR family oxidoreductase [Actinomycetota bacterium]